MNHSETRILILISVMMAMGPAHAQKSPDPPSPSSPPPTTATAAAPAAIAAPATAAPSAAAAAPSSPSAAMLRQAKLAGYHIKKLHDGTTVFCKNETHVGSRFSSESCIDEPQLAEFMIRAQTQRDNLNNRRGTGTDSH